MISISRVSVAVLVVTLAGCAAADAPVVDPSLDEAGGARRAIEAPRPPGARSPTADPDGWESDLEVALARGKEEHRPVLIDFWARWCGACHQLKKVTFVEEAFLEEASRFVLVRVDVSNDEDPAVLAIEKQWNVTELPLLVVLDADGETRERVVDFVSADALAPKLAAVR